MDDMRKQMLIEKLMICARSVSIIMAPRRRRAPAVDFPPSPTPTFITPPFLTPRCHLHLSTNSEGYSAPSAYSPSPTKYPVPL